jgi:DNA-directed RNA polymerase subunit omega
VPEPVVPGRWPVPLGGPFLPENRMSSRHQTMIDPRIEDLLERADDSKFRLVTLGAKRARQINSYFGQLGEGLGASIPPQVTSTARKPLSIAYEEIRADKIVAVEPEDLPEESEEAAEGEDDGDASS